MATSDSDCGGLSLLQSLRYMEMRRILGSWFALQVVGFMLTIHIRRSKYKRLWSVGRVCTRLQRHRRELAISTSVVCRPAGIECSVIGLICASAYPCRRISPRIYFHVCDVRPKDEWNLSSPCGVRRKGGRSTVDASYARGTVSLVARAFARRAHNEMGILDNAVSSSKVA